MLKQLKNILPNFSNSWQKRKSCQLFNKSVIFPFLFSFSLVFFFIEITLVRNNIIRNFKQELFNLEKYLNEFNIDIAYDNIKFNNMINSPLVEIKNFQLYNLHGRELWNLKIPEINIQPNLWNSNKINFQLSEQMSYTYGIKTYPISTITKFEITTNSNKQFDILHLNLASTNIKNYAQFEKVNFIARKLTTNQHNDLVMPSIESHLEIRDIKINGLLQYPLTSEIQKIYAKFNLMNDFSVDDSFKTSAESWLQNNGFIDIPQVSINWMPMNIVGKGTIRFNEELSPRVNINISSTAFLEFINDLQKNKFLDRKGVFVANILLNSKAFKLHEDDKYLTLTTPINYQDGKLSIENITVKTFNP